MKYVLYEGSMSDNAQIFSHVWGGIFFNMTLQQIPSKYSFF